jgi:2-phospho-L-lactate transferase/gluconeogenesis factor (CofD/UPF0052 family)
VTPPVTAISPDALRVVLFSGGRGSSALTEQLAVHPQIALTVAINGYDDGASTGEVRRFLGDALGPSDFRKNASRIARVTQSAPPALIRLLDTRLPDGSDAAVAQRLFDLIAATGEPWDDYSRQLAADAVALPLTMRADVAARLRAFDAERRATGRAFDFHDCSVGNLVFAGTFLQCARQFNPTVDSYCALLGLPHGLIENVSDGTNAFLVALDADHHLLGSEAAIVDARQENRIRDIFLIDAPLAEADIARLSAEPPAAIEQALLARARRIPFNARLALRLMEADLIIYAPGTQHSSLFPSYLTEGLPDVIASNVRATKLLITNLQPDAEIAGSSAVDLLDRALYYLRDRQHLQTPTPCLITHCLINDPGLINNPGRLHSPLDTSASAHVLPGELEQLEDPRLVRIANYEQGVSGRHDATKVLGPFLTRLLARRSRPRVALLLLRTERASKVLQTLLELFRGGVDRAPVDVTVFYTSDEPVPASVAADLPFTLRPLDRDKLDAQFRQVVREEQPDYVGLFDSSGMYNGEDLVGMLAQLPLGAPDAVWGSRRLSVREIRESTYLRYRRTPLLGILSYVGSHALSAFYLVGYGRYVSDTLSEARLVRAAYLLRCGVDVVHKDLNHHLLAAVLGDKAEIRELPVTFLPLSPARVRRTGVRDGLAALWTIIRLRLQRSTQPPQPPAAAADEATSPAKSSPVHPVL